MRSQAEPANEEIGIDVTEGVDLTRRLFDRKTHRALDALSRVDVLYRGSL